MCGVARLGATSSKGTAAVRTYRTSEGDLTAVEIEALGKPVVIGTSLSGHHDKITGTYLLVRHTRILPKAALAMEAAEAEVAEALFEAAYAELSELERLALRLGTGRWVDVYVRLAETLLAQADDGTDPDLVAILNQVGRLNSLGGDALTRVTQAHLLKPHTGDADPVLAAWPTIDALFGHACSTAWCTPAVAALMAPCWVSG